MISACVLVGEQSPQAERGVYCAVGEFQRAKAII
jgi:hypothetical protein